MTYNQQIISTLYGMRNKRPETRAWLRQAIRVEKRRSK